MFETQYNELALAVDLIAERIRALGEFAPGSYKEFGYWYRKDGKMKYVSITKKLRLFAEKDNEEIWKIFRYKNNSFTGIDTV